MERSVALGSSCTKGNVIIVTARNLSIAQRLGTVQPVKLGAGDGLLTAATPLARHT